MDEGKLFIPQLSIEYQLWALCPLLHKVQQICNKEQTLKSGWGIHVTPWLIHVNVWQNPLQYCKVISLQLIKINEKKVIKWISHCCLCNKCCKFLNLRWGQTMTHLTWAVTASWHPASSSLLFVTVVSKRSYWQDHEPLGKSWRENNVFLKRNSSTRGSMFSERFWSKSM